MLKTNYRCVLSLNIRVNVTKCVENVHKFSHYTHFLSVKKKTSPDWTIYSWQAFNWLRCSLMPKTNYRCVQSLNISVDVAKCVENVHNLTHYSHFLSVAKNDLSWLKNLFMASFQLIRMSSYAKNKLLMSSVNQHQCRWHQICGKYSQIHPAHSLFVRNKKWLVLTEQSINGKI